LAEQSEILRKVKTQIIEKQLYKASSEMLAAKTWLELAHIFIELLDSSHTISSLTQRIEKAGARLKKLGFCLSALSESELDFLARYLPLYLKLRPVKSGFGAPATVLHHLRFRFPFKKF